MWARNGCPKFEKWDDLGKFWFQLIQYTLPDPSIGEPDVDVTMKHRQVIVDLQLTQADRQALEAGSLRFLMPGADGRMVEVAAIPGGRLPLPGGDSQTPGRRIQRRDPLHHRRGTKHQILVPFAVNYPVEWQFEAPR